MGEELSTAQLKALALAPKITASFSIPCSIFIIVEVIRSHRGPPTPGGKNRAIHRALAGMSIIDVLASFGWFLSTWAVPREVENEVWNTGNLQTCNFQGFLLQLAIGAPMYNSTLALWYLLVIRYGWSDDQLRALEPWVHAAVLLFAVGTSIALLPLHQYNYIRSVCWIMGSPQGCQNSNYKPSDIECDRGNYAWIYGIALFYGPLWCCLVFTTAAMVAIYYRVRSVERRNQRYAGARTQSRRATFLRSDGVAVQALLYTSAFFITWLPSTIWSLAHWFDKPMFWLDMLQRLCEPSQGLLNFLVFLRPRKELQVRLYDAFSRLFCCFPCCCRQEDHHHEPKPDDQTGASEILPTSHHTTTNLVSEHALPKGEDEKDVERADSMINGEETSTSEAALEPLNGATEHSLEL